MPAEALLASPLLSLLLGALAGAVLAAFVAWLLARRAAEARIAEGRAQRDGEVARLVAERDSAQARVMQLEAERSDAGARLAAAHARGTELERDNATLAARGESLAAQLAALARSHEASSREADALRHELAQLRVATARIEEARDAEARLRTELEAFVSHAREQLGAKFGEVAGALFDQKSELFAQQSKRNLEALLKPFSDEVKGFRERAELLYGDEAKERARLKGQIDQLVGLNRDWSEQTRALTDALRGNVKHRGNWGELVLDKVLEASGLVENEHYTRQGGERDEEGRLRIPDIVVHLPDKRRVVVDSKVNLVAWQEAVNAQDDETRATALRAHVGALRRHVKDVAKKDYGALYGGTALDLVLVFVPIEGALSSALGEDPDLTFDALESRVVLVSPNTLVSVLRAIDYSWARTQSVARAQEIVRRAESIATSLERYLAAFATVGDRIRAAQNAFDTAEQRLKSVHGPINQVRKLQSLGVKGARRLGTLEDAGDEPDAGHGDDLLLDREPGE